MAQPARRTFLPGHVVVIICSITIQLSGKIIPGETDISYVAKERVTLLRNNMPKAAKKKYDFAVGPFISFQMNATAALAKFDS